MAIGDQDVPGEKGDKSRARVVLSAIVLATILSMFFTIQTEQGGDWARRLVGPINWGSFVLFFLGLGELFLMHRRMCKEREIFPCKLLPEDFGAVIDSSFIPTILQTLSQLPENKKSARLAKLVELCVLKYQSSPNVAEVADAMRMQFELEYSRAQARYWVVRYVLWGIPVLGFIGTVLGLSDALGGFGRVGDLNNAAAAIKDITNGLNHAFDTTFVALVLSFVLMYFYYRVFDREEELLNTTFDYCLKNFVTRAYYPLKA